MSEEEIEYVKSSLWRKCTLAYISVLTHVTRVTQGGAPAPFHFMVCGYLWISSSNVSMPSVNASIVADCEFPTVNS